MTVSVAELQPALHDLFHDTADALARDHGFCQRARKLTGSAFAQTLVFALLGNPDATLEDFAQFAEDHLDLAVSPQAFDQRFTAAAAHFLGALVAAALDRSFHAARPALLPVLRRFPGVYVRDATLLGLPADLAPWFAGHGACGTGGQAASLKLVLEWEVTTGQLTELSVLPGRANEKTAEVAAAPLPAGVLLLEDMGFLSGARLQDAVDQGVYVLTRIPVWTALFDAAGRRLDLRKELRKASGWRWERRVRLLHGRKIALRLLAERLPEEEAERRRQRVRAEARRHGRPVSQAKLELCAWNILVTNAPPEVLGGWEAGAVRRVRWQIELVFKALKGEGGLARTRSRCPWRVLSEVYAKLLGAIVQQGLLRAAGYVMLRHSLRRASRLVRRRAGRLLRALAESGGLAGPVARLSTLLKKRGQVERRQRHPSTLDRLAALDAEVRQHDEAA